MNKFDYIAQPNFRTTLDALQSIFEGGKIERIDVAMAYITSGGAFDFINRVTEILAESWTKVDKRWITSFDYCRTDPMALDYIEKIPNSLIRVHDAEFCLQHSCAPKIPFHPKVILVRKNNFDYVLAGSGNMSRSGLARGVEAGIIVSASRANSATEYANTTVSAMQNWFLNTWNHATPLSRDLLDRYEQIFECRENLKAPTPTEDDVASPDRGRGALSTKDLQRLRICRNFWIDAGKITKNRGPDLPGNQLMMKRLSRVFFGFSPNDLPENTHIGDIEIYHKGKSSGHFSLTFSDNKMDKLVLPIPDSGGPEAYDNQHLLFKKLKPGVFDLSLGTKTMRSQWQKKSEAISGDFKMTSGREWGVF